MTNYIDRAILRAARGSSPNNPIDLVGLLGRVDAIERMVLTHEELQGALGRLIKSGQLAEDRAQHFYVPSGPQKHRAFSGLTIEDHAQAVATYVRQFQEAVAASATEADDDPGGPLVVIRWAASELGQIKEADEDSAEELADRIEKALPRLAGAEILGFEQGAAEIDILIWGKGSNSEIDTIYEAIVPIYRQFGCPPGSHVIRYYDTGDRELPSDWIPAL